VNCTEPVIQSVFTPQNITPPVDSISSLPAIISEELSKCLSQQQPIAPITCRNSKSLKNHVIPDQNLHRRLPLRRHPLLRRSRPVRAQGIQMVGRPSSHPLAPLQPKTLTHSTSNCSICLKSNRLSLVIQPDQFKLLSPTSLDDVPEYQFGSKAQHHHFCNKCGIHTFAFGSYVWEGQTVKNFSINAVTLDPDQGVDLREFQMQYWDGKGENWKAGLAEKPYAGGTY